jgi:hypothetical protein
VSKERETLSKAFPVSVLRALWLGPKRTKKSNASTVEQTGLCSSSVPVCSRLNALALYHFIGAPP